jgi:hypothetical protein
MMSAGLLPVSSAINAMITTPMPPPAAAVRPAGRRPRWSDTWEGSRRARRLNFMADSPPA